MACNNTYYTGQVGYLHDIIESDSAPVLDASAYAAGDALHDGYLEFSCATIEDGGTGTIKEIIFIEDNNGTAVVGADLIAYVFHTAPAATITKNSALTLTDADINTSMVCTPIAMTTDSVLASNYNWTTSGAVDRVYKCASGNNKLYVVLAVSAGTPDYAAGVTGKVRIVVRKDS